METVSLDELRVLMNEAGEARRPFVWGVDYAMTKGFFLADPYQTGDILWHIGTSGNIPAEWDGTGKPALEIVSAPRKGDYDRMFAKVMHGLRRGDSFLANLTACTGVEIDGSLRDVFMSSSAPYRLLLGDCFVCFSPEPFVRIKDGEISTFPMKGTADASAPDQPDALLSDYKELCEHYTIVDLMRNDLNSVASEVEVRRFRYVERIVTTRGGLYQTSSEICGRLAPDRAFRFGDVLLPLLPAGSITGAPKPATVALIDSAEVSSRGWYTGVFGYFDGSVMDSAVMIRCIQRGEDGRLRFHSGGGVTVNSLCDDEYEELLEKIYLS